MITVLHLITALRRAGAEASLLRLVTGMDRTRFNNVVISVLPPTGYWDTFVERGIPVHSLGWRGAVSPQATAALARHIREIRPDVIQTWLYHADLLGLLVGRAISRAPVLWNIRNSDLAASGRASHALMVRALARLSPLVSAAVVNSQAGLDAHRAAGYRPKQWVLIPNGFDTAAFAPGADARALGRRALGFADDTFLVAMIARFDPMKNHGALIAALSAIRRERRDAHLVLLGRGVTPDNETLARAVREHGVEGHVTLLGERSDVAVLLPAFDVVAHPSSFGEGFPNAVCEAMACGVPVVATDVGDVRQILRAGGSVVPPNDGSALSKAILDIARLAPEARQALGRLGRVEIETRYSLQTTVSGYESLYAELAGERRG